MPNIILKHGSKANTGALTLAVGEVAVTINDGTPVLYVGTSTGTYEIVPSLARDATNATNYYDGATAVSIASKINDLYTKLTSTYRAKGSITIAGLLALSSKAQGDVYNITDAFTITSAFSEYVSGTTKTYPAGTNVVYTSDGKWDVLDGFIDLSAYAKTADLHDHTHSNKAILDTISAAFTSALKSNYDAAYTHSQTAHAPSDAQKNSAITKAEIEAKLTGDLTSHTHSMYITAHQDITGKEDTSNKTTAITNLSTDTQYPSAKAVYTDVKSPLQTHIGDAAMHQANVIESVKVNGTALAISNKAVDVKVLKTVTVSGSGNAITSATLSTDGTTLTLTKGATFLTSHQSLSGYATLTGLANGSNTDIIDGGTF